MAKMNSNKPVFVDLFCGAGGLSNGLEQAGFQSILGVDLDQNSIATYEANHPNAHSICSDISHITPKDIFRATGREEIDLIAGGPSCQGFSTHGKRIEDDPRNFLFKEFVRLVEGIRPKFVLIENVKGLLTFRNGYFRELIETSFGAAGYRISSKVLRAADFGVPQLRDRIFFIGTRLDSVEISFPEPTHAPNHDEAISIFKLAPYVTVEEAIGDLPLMKGDFDRELWTYKTPPKTSYQKYARENCKHKHVSLHQANPGSENARELMTLVKEGEGIRSIPLDKLPARFKKMRRLKDGSLRKDCTTLYHRLHRRAPAYTITCFFRNVASGPFMHPLEDRSLSFREAARLMSFKDDYEFQGTGIARQIGNSVPPLLAKAVGEHIIKLLKKTQEETLNKKRKVAAA